MGAFSANGQKIPAKNPWLKIPGRKIPAKKSRPKIHGRKIPVPTKCDVERPIVMDRERAGP